MTIPMKLALVALLVGVASGAVVSQANLRMQLNLTHNHPSLLTRFIQSEIEMTKANPPQVDKVLYVVFAMLFGICGCDRCFMGQVMLGCLKGFTIGGFGVWYIIDYWVCVYCALDMQKKIDLAGYHATFKPSSLEPAYYLAAAILITHVYQQYQAYTQSAMQNKEQEALEKRLKASETACNARMAEQANETSAPTEKRLDIVKLLDIPTRHQSLAFIPTFFTKGLRKAGVVSEKPTIPELIAAFAKMDKDGDGQLDPEEVKEGLAAMGASEDDVLEMIKTADTDGDGKISKQEFLVAFATDKKDA